jgi:hypothetical protein
LRRAVHEREPLWLHRHAAARPGLTTQDQSEHVAAIHHHREEALLRLIVAANWTATMIDGNATPPDVLRSAIQTIET